MGYVSLLEGPLVLTLGPGDPLPTAPCSVTIFGSPGQGVAVHVSSLALASTLPTPHCSSWLQLEAEHQLETGAWARTRTFSDRICGQVRRRTNFGVREPWSPRNHFFNETNTHEITVKFKAGNQDRDSLQFTLVVTPLVLGCSGEKAGFHGELLPCVGGGEGVTV